MDEKKIQATVLVVDDEASIRESLRMILEFEGYRVDEATSGSAALTRVAEGAPDAVVLDVKMPGMDGLDTLTAFRERGYAMPVLMISGHGEGTLAAQTGSLTVFLRISIFGEVVVLGIVSISILLALEARYQSGGSLICVGILRAKVKLGWMWEVKISRRVTYRLAGSSRSEGRGGGSNAPLSAVELAALPNDTTTRQRVIRYSIRRYLGTLGS